MQNKKISQFDLLCEYLFNLLKENELYSNYDVDKNGNQLTITVHLAKQQELRIELRPSFFGEKMAVLLLIRNDVNWNKVTRVYLEYSESNAWKILSLKKHNRKFRSLIFSRIFNSEKLNNYLTAF